MSKPWPEVPVGNENMTNAAVIIIGAGLSGMCTAIDLLKKNCHNMIIVEKSGGLGGTWHDNKYPGCCCDVWSHLYSLSFEQNPDWTREYPGQEEILSYLQTVAAKWNLYRYIRFNTSVDQAAWDDTEKKWKVDVRVSNGKDSEYTSAYTIASDYIVSAVGQLNVPRYPDIEGLDSFTGKKMHSARWDWSYDLKNKRIALIGNGATAAQIAPEVAKVAKSLTVFQRTPNWVIPRMDAPISDFKRAVYRYLPPVRHWYRAGMMDFRESFYAGVADPNSDFEKALEAMSQDMMKQQLSDKPELWPTLTPNYPTGCKRVIISDDFFPIFNLPNVQLCTSPITSIIPTGVQTTDQAHEFDLIILATGFRTVEFMYPIRIFGQGGKSIEEIWKGGAKAFYGVNVPWLPNFSMLYGPNTNLGHNSIILMIEAQSRYINQLIGVVLDARRQGQSLALTPKPARVDAYNSDIQSVLRTSTFAHPNCQSWYKTEEGLVTNNWSGTVIDYQTLLSKITWSDYDVDGSAASLVEAKEPTYIGRVVEEGQTSLLTLALEASAVLGVLAAVLWRSGGVWRAGAGVVGGSRG